MTDYYKILGVPRDVSQADLKKAFRKKIFEAHPDRHPQEKNAQAEEQAKQICEAYDALRELDSKDGAYGIPNGQKESRDYSTHKDDVPAGNEPYWTPGVAEWAEKMYEAWGIKKNRDPRVARTLAQMIRGSMKGQAMASIMIDSMYAEEHPENRYWIVYNRGKNGEEVRGFPSFRAQEHFLRETGPITEAELFQIDHDSLDILVENDNQREQIKQTLESMAQDRTKRVTRSRAEFNLPVTQNWQKDIEPLMLISHNTYSPLFSVSIGENSEYFSDQIDYTKVNRFRMRNDILHTILKEGIHKVRVFNPTLFETEILPYLRQGFEWYRSEWGESFVGVGNGSHYRVIEIEPHQKGVIYNVENTTPHKMFTSKEKNPNMYYKPTMFNLFYEDLSLIGKIYHEGNVVGIYIERNPLDVFTTFLGSWSYGEFGKSKEVFLRPGVLDASQFSSGQVPIGNRLR